MIPTNPSEIVTTLFSSLLVLFDSLSGLLTLVSIVVGIMFFLIEQKRENERSSNELKQRLSRSIQTMLTDLEIIKEAFFTQKYKKVQHDKIDFTHIQAGTEIYHSMVSSGLFTFLGKATQIQISHLYFNIEMHNQYILEMNRYYIEDALGYGTKSTHSDVDDAIGALVTRYESEIKERLPKVKISLKKELVKLNKAGSKTLKKKILLFWACRRNH
jgi:hypothetical protein